MTEFIIAVAIVTGMFWATDHYMMHDTAADAVVNYISGGVR